MKGEWISVKDRLPEAGIKVIIFATFCDGYICISFLNENGNWDDFRSHVVTHWMPLPEAPE